MGNTQFRIDEDGTIIRDNEPKREVPHKKKENKKSPLGGILAFCFIAAAAVLIYMFVQGQSSPQTYEGYSQNAQGVYYRINEQPSSTYSNQNFAVSSHEEQTPSAAANLSEEDLRILESLDAGLEEEIAADLAEYYEENNYPDEEYFRTTDNDYW